MEVQFEVELKMRMENTKRTKSGCFFKCPTCHNTFRVSSLRDHRHGDDSTCDCPHCGELILIVKGKARKFHREMHKTDPVWPKDGRGTGWIEI